MGLIISYKPYEPPIGIKKLMFSKEKTFFKINPQSDIRQPQMRLLTGKIISSYDTVKSKRGSYEISRYNF